MHKPDFLSMGAIYELTFFFTDEQPFQIHIGPVTSCTTWNVSSNSD